MTSVSKRRRPVGTSSTYQRYVTRAGYLQDNKPFQASIERSRSGWDEKYHEQFPIGSPGHNPPPNSAWSCPAPTKLASLMDNVVVDASLDPAHTKVAWSAWGDWQKLVATLCNEWWPRDDFWDVDAADH